MMQQNGRQYWVALKTSQKPTFRVYPCSHDNLSNTGDAGNEFYLATWVSPLDLKGLIAALSLHIPRVSNPIILATLPFKVRVNRRGSVLPRTVDGSGRHQLPVLPPGHIPGRKVPRFDGRCP
jgi:hypothetical protein